jgi:hypothetical protein
VEKLFVDDPVTGGISEHNGEPHLVIGHLLASEYNNMLASPIPAKILSLLVQIEYRERMADNKASEVKDASPLTPELRSEVGPPGDNRPVQVTPRLLIGVIASCRSFARRLHGPRRSGYGRSD